MRRREFIAGLAGAAAWPLTARAHQPMPLIGLLSSQTHDAVADYMLRGFRGGLKDTGYVEGNNLAVDYRWGENQSERLPALAAELVRRQVAVIVTYGGPASEAVVNVKTTIPLVFM